MGSLILGQEQLIKNMRKWILTIIARPDQLIAQHSGKLGEKIEFPADEINTILMNDDGENEKEEGDGNGNANGNGKWNRGAVMSGSLPANQVQLLWMDETS